MSFKRLGKLSELFDSATKNSLLQHIYLKFFIRLTTESLRATVMNCHCDPPQPASIKTSSKIDTKGKEFFCCRSGVCDLFHWIGSSIPNSLNARIPLQQRSFAAVGCETLDRRIPIPFCLKQNSAFVLKLHISEFEDISTSQRSPRIWFNSIGPINHQILKFYNCFSSELRKYNDRLKIWSFDFIIYEQFVSKFLSSDIQANFKGDGIGANLEEIPKFLVLGLRNFLSSYIGGVPDASDLRLEDDLLDTLLPFQLDGIKFVVQHNGRALIGDEVRNLVNVI